MKTIQLLSAVLALAICSPGFAGARHDAPANHDDDHHNVNKTAASVQLGPRPFYLVNDMDPGKLKNELLDCTKGPFRKTDFSIGHRGAVSGTHPRVL